MVTLGTDVLLILIKKAILTENVEKGIDFFKVSNRKQNL